MKLRYGITTAKMTFWKEACRKHCWKSIKSLLPVFSPFYSSSYFIEDKIYDTKYLSFDGENWPI